MVFVGKAAVFYEIFSHIESSWTKPYNYAMLVSVSARSSGDRALVFGTKCRGFESLRAY